MPDWRVIQGDVLARLGELPEESVHCVVTSPPYWGLRDYGVEGQIGIEPTPDLYVERMVEVFREVRRVLRKDGTLWLNMGDCYAGGKAGTDTGVEGGHWNDRNGRRGREAAGLKPKDLVGMPWRLAFALQADGWWLRCDIIWSKPNPMPESVTDRPTRAHEYVFLMSKAARYYYDAEAVRERGTSGPSDIKKMAEGKERIGGKHKDLDDHLSKASKYTNIGHRRGVGSPMRNKRSVWEIATQPYPGAHFATFPEKLVEPCVRAGTGEEGCCPMCGAAFLRMIEVNYAKSPKHGAGSVVGRHEPTGQNNYDGAGMPRLSKEVLTTGWRPGCDCPIWKAEVHQDPEMPDEYGPADFPIPCTVLDPFCGSGTTGAVALRLGRSFVGIELNAEYCKLARKRIGEAAPLFAKEAPQ